MLETEGQLGSDKYACCFETKNQMTARQGAEEGTDVKGSSARGPWQVI